MVVVAGETIVGVDSMALAVGAPKRTENRLPAAIRPDPVGWTVMAGVPVAPAVDAVKFVCPIAFTAEPVKLPKNTIPFSVGVADVLVKVPFATERTELPVMDTVGTGDDVANDAFCEAKLMDDRLKMGPLKICEP